MPYLDWTLFLILVPLLLAIDLKLFNKGEDNIIGFRKSLILSAWYIAAGLAFGLLIWWDLGEEKAALYYNVYVIEKSLSLDNLFVMSLIFSSFAIPRQYQHRVLIWGIIGVIILRGIMIFAGAALVTQFSWVLFIFAAILIYTATKMIFIIQDETPQDFDKKPLVIFLKKHFPFTSEIHGNKFWIRQQHPSITGKTVFVATPLFLALIVIEFTDILFAVDSIPAALAITTDPLIVYSSNIFAVLGLRALFFAVENVITRFELMKYALSFVLFFIGFKVFYNGFSGYHIEPNTSLAITLGALTAGFIFSWIKTKNQN